MQGKDLGSDEYQQEFQNALMAMQRELNLRNRNVVINAPQKKLVEDHPSGSGTGAQKENKGLNIIQGKGKEIINKENITKGQIKEKIPPQEPPIKIVEEKKDVIIAEKIDKSFSFESEMAKIKISLPFNEICKNKEYKDQLIKMLKVDDKIVCSDTVNLQDYNPTILFGPRAEGPQDEDVPPFYVTIKVHDQNLHNAMIDSGASHNLMPKEIMDNLGLEITRQYKDLYSFHSRKLKCPRLIKDLVVSLHQIPEKSIVMDIVVVEVPGKFGLLLSRSWSAKLKGTMQMDMSYATIPVFGVQRRLYRENRLKYMINSKECPENHPIYVVDTDMGSAIFYNSEHNDLEDHLIRMHKNQEIEESKEETDVDCDNAEKWFTMHFDGACSKEG